MTEEEEEEKKKTKGARRTRDSHGTFAFVRAAIEDDSSESRPRDYLSHRSPLSRPSRPDNYAINLLDE